jgi:cell division protease FtsH
VSDAHERARSILAEHRDKLDAVAQKLLEVETLTKDEFEAIFPPPVKKNGVPALVAAV